MHWDKVKAAVKSFGRAVVEALKGTEVGRALLWIYAELEKFAAWFFDVGIKIAVNIAKGMKKGVMDGIDYVTGKIDDFIDFGTNAKPVTPLINSIAPLLNVATPNAPRPVTPGPVQQSYSVDMSGMTINATDGTDFGNKAWGVLKPKFADNVRTVEANRARTKMGD
jgi:hypothetical protein